MLLSALSFGAADVGQSMMIQRISPIAAWTAVVVFPFTIALAELPTYFGYAMPRLEHRWRSPSLALGASARALAAQHAALPLIADTRFIVWRMLAYLPFALWLGWAIQRRRARLPFILVVHGLLDLAAVCVVATASS